MIIGLKDVVKLFGIAIMACCAVFVCTLVLSYNIDLASIKSEITSEKGIAMYNAQVLMGKVTAGVSGGCLVITSVVMLLFYVKNYVDTHGKELGILKALGYSDIKIAKHFWIFGLSVLVGCIAGFAAGFIYLPEFYNKNANDLFPELAVRFHPSLTFLLVFVPAIVFAGISVLFAWVRLHSPVLDLLKEKRQKPAKPHKGDKKERPFLKSLTSTTIKGKKSLVFFVAFSAFCFSAMVQMAFSMKALASETFAGMILTIGLILAFVTLFLSLSAVVKGNAKTIATMRVFGYEDSVCSRYILGAYRPVSYIGFVAGTFYQYGLLKLMVNLVFSEVENVPEYNFDFKALVLTLFLFVASYELVMYMFSLRIKKLSIKSIMSE